MTPFMYFTLGFALGATFVAELPRLMDWIKRKRRKE